MSLSAFDLPSTMWIVIEAVMSFTREANVRDIPLSDPGPSKCSKVLVSITGVVAIRRSIKRACIGNSIKATLRWMLNVGLVFSIGLTGFSHTSAAASSQKNLAITIHMRDYAGIAPETLRESEEVATEIFREAGAETRWVVIVPTAKNDPVNWADHPTFTSADIQLSILPSKMSDRLDVPSNVMGLAPGTDTQVIYVFNSKVESIFWWLLRERWDGRLDRKVSRAEVLGHVIAHELGHLLLNMTGHSALGIMHGEWNLTDFQNAVRGQLLFTPEQAEAIQANIRRRRGQREMLAHGD